MRFKYWRLPLLDQRRSPFPYYTSYDRGTENAGTACGHDLDCISLDAQVTNEELLHNEIRPSTLRCGE